MSQARDATAPRPDGSSPFVKILEIPDDLCVDKDLADTLLPHANSSNTHPNYLQFLAEIRHHLSENCLIGLCCAGMEHDKKRKGQELNQHWVSADDREAS